MKLSEHFELSEMTISQAAARRGLPNEPTADQIENLSALCRHVLEPLRAAVGRPIVVSSGFRSGIVNTMAGGSKKSDHRHGLAADITIPGMSPIEVCRKIVELKLPAKQIICEFGQWTHVSLSRTLSAPELLTASLVGGKVQYSKGLS